MKTNYKKEKKKRIALFDILYVRSNVACMCSACVYRNI